MTQHQIGELVDLALLQKIWLEHVCCNNSMIQYNICLLQILPQVLAQELLTHGGYFGRSSVGTAF